MLPRLASSQSLFRNIYHLARQPTRLRVGVAAAAVSAAAVVSVGVSAGVSAGSAHPVSAISNLDTTGQAGAVRAAGQAGAPIFSAASRPASSGHLLSRPATSRPAVADPAAFGQAATHPAHHPAARVRLASRKHTRQPAVVRPPAKSRHVGGPQHAARPQHPAATRDRARQHPSAVRHPAPRRRPAARRRPAPAARLARPFLIYDSITPSAIPAHHVVATYATGNYAVSPGQVAGRPTMWIDTTGTDYAASVLDVEPGDATPSLAATWAWHRLTAKPSAVARLYTMRSEWPAVQAAVATLPSWMRTHIRWWIADPTGSPHVVPGSDATQWYWGPNYDITTATPRF